MSESLDTGLHWRHATAAGQPVLRTMVVCDLADSTALVERLGDRRAAALLRKHDRLTRALIDEHNGREIDKTDGYLLLFERPTQAVSFALAYQRGLRFMSEAEEVEVHARVGIHVGDVVMWENSPEDISRGAKPVEVEGLAKPVAARLAALARPQQILLSGVAASIARRGHEEIAEDCPEAEWRSHGLYRIRGVAEATEVFEVGEPGIADFTIPAQRSVARRILPWWRRPSTISGASLLIALIIGTSIWAIVRQPPTIDFSARDWVVVAATQNQTGQDNYDNTITAAIRMSLRQSRFVNVISAQQVAQTLKRMKKDASAPLDRKTGVEVALRDNASALIVPRLANNGHELVLSAEIVDSNTNKIVKTISTKIQSQSEIVPAIDDLTRSLRASLGESMAQIKSTSIPLAKVTTSNLDALRAYSLADQAAGRGDLNLSVDLLNHAISLDPKFASAYAAQASNYFATGNMTQARREIDKAMKFKQHLTPLELLKLKAMALTARSSRTAATAAWKMIADLYPDNAAGANNVGLNYAAELNDCDSALPYLQHAANLPQPLQPVSLYILASCQLALGHEDQAIQNFKRSYAEGFRGRFLALADAYVATRQYTKASTFLTNVPSDIDTIVSLSTRRALLVADQGDLSSAENNIRHALQTIPKPIYNSYGWSLRLEYIGILWAQGKEQDALDQTRHGLKQLLSIPVDKRDDNPYDFPVLVALFSRWAARLGDVQLAKQSIKIINTDKGLRGFPIRAQLVTVTQAEIALKEGDPEKAVRIATGADTHPLWELLEVIARAKAAAGDPGAAAAYKRVIAQRPLAFGELFENELGICTRAIQWNFAVLDYAKVLSKTDPSAASRQASIFLDYWRIAPSDLQAVITAKKLMQWSSSENLKSSRSLSDRP
ncbi:putative peptide modification system cyclase [Oleiagrimonas sp. MCCC 1A03011]|uniref:putative peptide modification system cyclase n=1 Tax=Oleiagrimonas sp. MCCC 1A03011 TaxID=1926883 RepID=UPI000DC42B16|nr:putative peptide modification system cyclase [Oleiagrimonas sp. MCCC 1A03011]RAP57177.1 hypothetical protein BTJ49_11525 [Oleiagrimonas sp. MCCC 1A03011]